MRKNIKTTSSGSSGTEDFDWVKNNQFEQDLKDSKFTYEGNYYKHRVNTILEYDIFKDLEFHNEKKYKFDFNFENYYKIDYSPLKRPGIKPDFFVYKIPKK